MLFQLTTLCMIVQMSYVSSNRHHKGLLQSFVLQYNHLAFYTTTLRQHLNKLQYGACKHSSKFSRCSDIKPTLIKPFWFKKFTYIARIMKLKAMNYCYNRTRIK